MVIDSSALIAILRREPERAALEAAIEAAEMCLLSAVTLLETTIVAIGTGRAAAAQDIDDLLSAMSIRSSLSTSTKPRSLAMRSYVTGKDAMPLD